MFKVILNTLGVAITMSACSDTTAKIYEEQDNTIVEAYDSVKEIPHEVCDSDNIGVSELADGTMLILCGGRVLVSIAEGEPKTIGDMK